MNQVRQKVTQGLMNIWIKFLGISNDRFLTEKLLRQCREIVEDKSMCRGLATCLYHGACCLYSDLKTANL